MAARGGSVQVAPGAASPASPALHLVQVLRILGLVFFHFFPGSLRCDFMVPRRGVQRTGPGPRLPLWEKETASRRRRGKGNPPLRWSPQDPACCLLPHFPGMIAVLCCAGGLGPTIWHISEKLILTEGLAQTLAADTEEKQTVHCAKRGRRESNSNPECSLPLAAAPRDPFLLHRLQNDTV